MHHPRILQVSMLGAISARVVLIGGIFRISSSFYVHISELSLIDDWMRGVSSQISKRIY